MRRSAKSWVMKVILGFLALTFVAFFGGVGGFGGFSTGGRGGGRAGSVGNLNSLVQVGDIANVTYGYKKPTARVRTNGLPAIAINATRQVGANVIETMKGMSTTGMTAITWPTP